MKLDRNNIVSIMVLGLFLEGCGVSTEARDYVGDYLEGKVVRCGDFHYVQNKQWLVEMKDFHFKIEPRDLTEASRMNGYEFGGYVNFSASAFRVIDSDGEKCWGSWQSGNLSPYFPPLLEIYKQKEEWKLDSTWLGSLPEDSAAPECSSVRKIVECSK